MRINFQELIELKKQIEFDYEMEKYLKGWSQNGQPLFFVYSMSKMFVGDIFAFSSR